MLAAAVLVLGVAPAPARPQTRECSGLQVCVPVAGPWVVVPTGGGSARRTVQFQLTCPRRYVVGGLDAELSQRGIELTFLGRLGAPVNPGITTSRAAVFVAAYVGGSPHAPTFRPHIGCMPAGGGGQRIPTAAILVPPGQPTVRRVRVARLAPGTRRVVQPCAAGEAVVGGWHAIAFRTAKPPAAALVQSVSASRSTSVRRVSVVVRSGAAVRGRRALVQVGAVCAGGR
jgi:hypothetical protein